MEQNFKISGLADSVSDGRRFFEIAAVLLTGLSKYIFVDLLPYKFWYILAACLLWIGYAASRFIIQPDVLEYWGFSRKTFRTTFLRLLPFAVACVITFLVVGLVRKTAIVNWHILPILLFYPLWGVIQQFMIMALIAGNLRDLDRIRLPKILIIVISACVFSIVHYPSLYLIAGTFILALLYAVVYLKSRNLWALGIYHGWLGCFYYFFILHRDPWLEVVRTM
ncbi:MAG: type II CAAX prenyl endopeptidase Rce1 family protein [Bacteroidota bacterium]